MIEKVKYYDEIIEFLQSIYRQDWMDEDDWKMFLDECVQKGIISIEKLSIDLETGIKNGYSLKKQFEITRNLLA